MNPLTEKPTEVVALKTKYTTTTRRRQLFRELAYCRIELARARPSRHERRIAFWREECERLRRCIDAKPRKIGVVVFPEIRREVLAWVEKAKRNDIERRAREEVW